MRRTLHAAIAVATLAATVTPASSQVFVDAFAGRSMPKNTAATLRANEARVNDTIIPARLRVDVETLRPTHSTIFGARIGYWSGAVGVAVDASTLDPDVKRQTIRATGNLRFDDDVFGERVVIDPGVSVAVDIPRITVPTTATFAALAMLRVPPTPGTRVTPYAFAGPVYLVTDSDISGDWGLRGGAGLKVPLSPSVSLFGEYRYTSVAASAVAGRIGGDVMGVSGTTGDIRIDLDVRNHSAVGGIGFTF